MKEVVVIPTYNERENIKVLIPLIFDNIPGISVVVADDNSPDGTGKVVSDLKYKYPNLILVTRESKGGLGKAYINAFKEVLKDINVRKIVMMDADMSHDPKYLNQMIKESDKYSVVVGSRDVVGGKTE